MLRGIFAIVFLVSALSVLASPEKDFDKFVSYFKDRFPNTPYEDYKNGVYSIDASAREQWEAMEEFPPYELNVDRGEELFNQAFKNGNTYGSCFEKEGIGIRQNYPYFDTDRNKVVTLEGALND
jgi:sulfur-oxidizing protein SoxA